jgi:CubicO group peptidase (beta-lactamase class C family)
MGNNRSKFVRMVYGRASTTLSIPLIRPIVKGFIVLKDGKIVLEKYFGNFTQDSSWYWASAGKSLTAFAVGIAQQKGLLSIDNPVSNYLGDGWTSCTKAQEEKITVRHLLMMSSGLDDNTSNPFCNEPSCLTYKAEPGTRWAYNTGVYSPLDKNN